MGGTLLDQFIKNECTAHVRTLLQEFLDASTGSERFEFNRFEITVDIEEGTVLLEDVLDASDAGTQRMELAEFAAGLAAISP